MSFSRKLPWPNQKLVAPHSEYAYFRLAYVKKVSLVLLFFYLLPINLFAWTNGELLISNLQQDLGDGGQNHADKELKVRMKESRPVQYLNNVLEQDHRAIKRRVRANQHFCSFWGAWPTIAGYEAIHQLDDDEPHVRRRPFAYSVAI